MEYYPIDTERNKRRKNEEEIKRNKIRNKKGNILLVKCTTY
jgi:hypothetical protein